MSERYGLFIEPEGELRALITSWKSRVGARWPSARYLSHPPHATVWAGTLTDPDEARSSLESAAGVFAREPVLVDRTHVFHDDALAEGGQTLAFAADPSGALRALQAAVRAALDAFIVEDYPFAGAQWLPHFTVASLPVTRDDEAVREFLAMRMPPLTTPCRVSWWRIEGDRHEKLMEL